MFDAAHFMPLVASATAAEEQVRFRSTFTPILLHFTPILLHFHPILLRLDSTCTLFLLCVFRHFSQSTVHIPLCDKEYEGLPLRFRLSDDEVVGEKRDALLSSYMNLTTVPKGEHEWMKEFVCADLTRDGENTSHPSRALVSVGVFERLLAFAGTNELVKEMLDQFVAAAEHQFKVVGPDEPSGGAAALNKTMSPRSQAVADSMLAQQ